MAMEVLQIPMTMTSEGKAVGARKPPSKLALCCYGPCAISGYETGDPTDGMFEGFALIVFILYLLIAPIGMLVACLGYTPDPANIRGDGTQRTVNNKCLAGCCVGFPAIAFWEYGDFCCTPEDGCVCMSGEAFMGCCLWFVPHALIGIGFDCCYVMCIWKENPYLFKRSLLDHGGGKDIVGAPVQTTEGNIELSRLAAAGGGVIPVTVGTTNSQQTE